MNIQSMLHSAALSINLLGTTVMAGEANINTDPSWAADARQKISDDVIAVVSPEGFVARFSRKAMPRKESYTYKITNWEHDGAVFEVHKQDGSLITLESSFDEDTLHSVGFYHAVTGEVNWPIE